MVPLKVRLGASFVTIYQTRKKPALYRVTWYEGAERHHRSFARLHPEHPKDIDCAMAEAKAIVSRLSTGQVEFTKISADRLRHLLECEKLATDNGMSLWQAIQDGLSFRRQNGSLTPATPAKLVKAMLEAKEGDRLSDVYLRVLRGNLTPFVAKFEKPIHEITTPEIEDWLRTQHKGDSPRTRKNTLGSLRTLFAYAKSQNALLVDRPTEAERVPTPKVTADRAVEIFSVSDMEKLLKAATAGGEAHRVLPVLVLGGFCGVRTDGEIQRLTWEDVREDQVVVDKQKLRGAGRRYVPLPENARAWLALCKHRHGLIWRQGQNVASGFRAIRTKAVVAWKKNGLRHSFISYRVAETQNAAQTALEAGNSVQMIHRHYRELVTKEEAGKWFGIRPAK